MRNNIIKRIEDSTNLSLYEIFIISVLVDTNRIEDAIDALESFHKPLEVTVK